MSRAWAAGSTRAWRRVRAYVLARDGYRCQVALPGTWRTRDGHVRRCLGVASQVHHLDGKARGDDPARLVSACRPCNLKVGQPGVTVVNGSDGKRRYGGQHRPDGRAADPAPRPMTKWT